jgi:hypothetical protein
LIVAAEFIVALLRITVAGEPANDGLAVPAGYAMVPGGTLPRYRMRFGDPLGAGGDQPTEEFCGCEAVLRSQLRVAPAPFPV